VLIPSFWNPVVLKELLAVLAGAPAPRPRTGAALRFAAEKVALSVTALLEPVKFHEANVLDCANTESGETSPNKQEKRMAALLRTEPEAFATSNKKPSTKLQQCQLEELSRGKTTPINNPKKPVFNHRPRIFFRANTVIDNALSRDRMLG